MASRLKQWSEAVVAASGVAILARALNRRRPLVLAYHNILPSGCKPVGDLSLHLTREGFAAQLDLLARTHDIVPLTDVRSESYRGRGRPRAAITFDDAYTGAITVGVEELEVRRLPATIFVAPAFVGGKSFWWDRFARPGGLPEEFRHRALTTFRGDDRLVSSLARESGVPEREIPPYACCGTVEHLVRATSVPGITIGSHTFSHSNLQALSPSEVHAELESSRDWLLRVFPAVIPWISYPYGLSPTGVEEIARELGYEFGVKVFGGRVRLNAHGPFDLPRVNIPAAVSINGFQNRVSGVYNG